MYDNTFRQRFTRKIQYGANESQCWLWTASRSKGGYGQIWLSDQRTMAYAHRISYLLHVGPIPDGLHIDHLCRVRHCVNPRHLEPVTNRVNSLRGVGVGAINARLTACRRGHPFDAANTKWDSRGHRACRTCINDRRRATGWH